MLKFIFWTLLGLNAVLLAYGQGLLGSFKASEREPARIKNQINTDKLVLQAPQGKQGSTGPQGSPLAAVLPSPPSALPELAPAPANGMIACTELGNFTAAEGRRFERLTAPLQLGERQSQQEVAAQEITSYMVMIPPLGSKEAADNKAAELKAQGVSSFFILNQTTPAKWAISLGVFKAETAAQTQLAALKKQGVTGARVAGRSSAATRLVYRFRNIDAATLVKLEATAARFTAETRTCE